MQQSLDWLSRFVLIVLVFLAISSTVLILSRCFHQCHFQLEQAAAFSVEAPIIATLLYLPNTKWQTDKVGS